MENQFWIKLICSLVMLAVAGIILLVLVIQSRLQRLKPATEA